MKASELDAGLIERIKSLLSGADDTELTISFNDDAAQYYKILERSKRDVEEQRDLVSFTMAELQAYSAKRNE